MTDQFDRLNVPRASSTRTGSNLESSLESLSDAVDDVTAGASAVAAAFGEVGGEIVADYFAAQQAIEERFFASESEVTSFAAMPTDRAQLTRLNVVGTAIGDKETQRGVTGQLAVRVYVVEKLAESALGADKIPETINGIPTDVVEVGNVRALECCNRSIFDFQSRQPRRNDSTPDGGVRCGASIGRDGIGFGTFGCLCVRDGKLFMLSNNHVLDNTNRGRPGDIIYQPGFNHGGRSPQDFVARLRHSIEIVMSRNASNTVDAALAQTDFRFVHGSHHCYTTETNPLSASVRQTVKKEGARTGCTLGRVVGVNANVVVGYPTGNARFTGQIEISGISGVFSRPGDSGSLVVSDPGNRPMGLLFAGDENQNLTWANPIGQVMSMLNIERLVNQFE